MYITMPIPPRDVMTEIKFLAMHIANQKLRFYIFMVGNVQNIFMEHDFYLIS